MAVLRSRHRDFAAALDAFAADIDDAHGDDVDETCRSLVRRLGAAGLLEASVAGDQSNALIDSAGCLARETLAWHSGLADFAFAMQGLGTGAVAIAGSNELRAQVLPKARRGEWIAAFALSEKEAGSDVAAMNCRARQDGGHYVLDGEKTWISNGGIAESIRCLREPAKRRARGAFRRSWCFRTIPGFRSPSAST